MSEDIIVEQSYFSISEIAGQPGLAKYNYWEEISRDISLESGQLRSQASHVLIINFMMVKVVREGRPNN